MKLNELPIYWDLLRLPLPVLANRLKKRFVRTTQKELPSPDLTRLSKLQLLHFDDFPTIASTEKWPILLRHYQKEELTFLGSGWVSLKNEARPKGFEGFHYGNLVRKELPSQEIDWNRDHRTGFRFEIFGEPERELAKAFATEGVDVKFCWEFARMHHLPQVGIMARLYPKRKKELAKLFERHFHTFTYQSPYGKGIHWSSPMEVSVRLVNILVGYNLLLPQGEALEKKVREFAYEHLYFVYHHLEHKDGFGTNHYLSNLMGLVVGGFYFQEDPQARKWQEWALREFEKELQKQFFGDGGNFEYSIYYHRLSTEIVLITYVFGNRSGYQFSPNSEQALAKAIDFLLKIRKGDWRLPMFGDNDSGRILDLDPEGELLEKDFHPTPEKSRFIHQIFEEGSIYGWFFRQLLGKQELPEVTAGKAPVIKESSGSFPKHSSVWEIPFQKVEVEKIRSYRFAETGLFVFKSEEFYLAVNLMANPKGHRYRGHMHNDKGSFELQVHGQDLALDPGVLSYTASAEMRNRYRSTKAHNIPWTGTEQNRYLPGSLGLFHVKLDVKTEVLGISETSFTCVVKYRGVKHIRRFEIFEERLVVTDWCNKPFSIKDDQEILPTGGYGKPNFNNF